MTTKLAMNFVKDVNEKKIVKVVEDKSAQVVEKRRVADMTGVESVKAVRREVVKEIKREENGTVNVKIVEWSVFFEA